MIVQPALEFVKQVTTGGPSVQTLLEPSQDIAALMLGHRSESQRLPREDLMINERASPGFVSHAQRAGIGGLEGVSCAEVAP